MRDACREDEDRSKDGERLSRVRRRENADRPPQVPDARRTTPIDFNAITRSRYGERYFT
jgi:hypothetical protein